MLIFILFAFFIHWGEFLKILNFWCINNDDYSVLKKNLPDSLPINEEHKKKITSVDLLFSVIIFFNKLAIFAFPWGIFFPYHLQANNFLGLH